MSQPKGMMPGYLGPGALLPELEVCIVLVPCSYAFVSSQCAGE